MALSPQDLNASFLTKGAETLSQFLQHGILPGAQPVQADLGRAEADPSSVRSVYLPDHLSGMEQRLGWDAAVIQAYPAETLGTVDQDYLFPLVRSIKCRGIASGPCTYNYNVSFKWFHLFAKKPDKKVHL